MAAGTLSPDPVLDELLDNLVNSPDGEVASSFKAGPKSTSGPNGPSSASAGPQFGGFGNKWGGTGLGGNSTKRTGDDFPALGSASASSSAFPSLRPSSGFSSAAPSASTSYSAFAASNKVTFMGGIKIVTKPKKGKASTTAAVEKEAAATSAALSAAAAAFVPEPEPEPEPEVKRMTRSEAAEKIVAHIKAQGVMSLKV